MTQPRRLGTFVLAALCFVLLSLPHLGATQKESAHAAIIIVTPEANKSTLEDFSWLAGRWEGHLGPTTAEQQWMTPKNGTMQGFFRLTDAEKNHRHRAFHDSRNARRHRVLLPPFFSG